MNALIAKIVGYFNVFKGIIPYFIILCLLVFIIFLQNKNLQLENKYLKCDIEYKSFIEELQDAKERADLEASNAKSLIEKNTELTSLKKSKIEVNNESNPLDTLRSYL
jgi:hypothetical protein